MELIGEEKRIQTLFRELRLADEHVASRFDVVWNRAQSTPSAPHRTFRFSLVAAMAFTVCVLVSVAWLLRPWQRSQELNSAVVLAVPLASVDIAPTGVHLGIHFVAPADSGRRSESQSRLMRLLARRRAEALAAKREEVRNAAAISNWQSPTTALMSSPVDQVLTSLPQLNESANALKSFLPGSSN